MDSVERTIERYKAALAEALQKLESMTDDRDQARKTSAWNKENHLAAEAEIEWLKAEAISHTSEKGLLRVRAQKAEGDLKDAKLQNGALEKLVRSLADGLYATGKGMRDVGDERGQQFMGIATNAHRQCGIIKGEDPLPHAGQNLSDWVAENRADVCQHEPVKFCEEVVIGDADKERCGIAIPCPLHGGGGGNS